jgi:hypothetical protein
VFGVLAEGLVGDVAGGSLGLLGAVGFGGNLGDVRVDGSSAVFFSLLVRGGILMLVLVMLALKQLLPEGLASILQFSHVGEVRRNPRLWVTFVVDCLGFFIACNR